MNSLIFPLIVFIYFILVVILIINIHERNEVIKKISILFFSFVFIAIVFYDETVLEQFLYYFIKFLCFPSYYVYVFTVLFMVLVFIYSVFNSKLSNRIRIFNYAFCGMALVSYIIFLILNIDTSIYKELYEGSSLICLRLVSRGFVIWVSSLLIVKYYKYFVRKG